MEENLNKETMQKCLNALAFFLKKHNLFNKWVNRLHEFNFTPVSHYLENGFKDMFWMPGMRPGEPEPGNTDWELINSRWQGFLEGYLGEVSWKLLSQ